MTKRWLIGIVASIALVSMVGVGFSAFTTNAYVNGTANAGTASLLVSASSATSCVFYSGGVPDTEDAQVSIIPADTFVTSVSVQVSNGVPGDICAIPLELENAGTVALSVSETVTATSPAMCPTWPDLNCWGAGTDTPYLTTNGPSTGLVTGFLPAGGTWVVFAFVEFAPFSTSAPAVPGSFTIEFTGTAGD